MSVRVTSVVGRSSQSTLAVARVVSTVVVEVVPLVELVEVVVVEFVVVAVAAQPASSTAEACTAIEVAPRVRELTGGLMADLVVEATGTADGVSLALELVRPRGTVALKTTCGLPPTRLDLTRAVVNEVRFTGSRCGPFAKALDALATAAIPVESLIEARFALDELGQAFDAARSRAKVLVYASSNRPA